MESSGLPPRIWNQGKEAIPLTMIPLTFGPPAPGAEPGQFLRSAFAGFSILLAQIVEYKD
jgi:hypothetical protein